MLNLMMTNYSLCKFVYGVDSKMRPLYHRISNRNFRSRVGMNMRSIPGVKDCIQELIHINTRQKAILFITYKPGIDLQKVKFKTCVNLFNLTYKTVTEPNFSYLKTA